MSPKLPLSCNPASPDPARPALPARFYLCTSRPLEQLSLLHINVNGLGLLALARRA